MISWIFFGHQQVKNNSALYISFGKHLGSSQLSLCFCCIQIFVAIVALLALLFINVSKRSFTFYFQNVTRAWNGAENKYIF